MKFEFLEEWLGADKKRSWASRFGSGKRDRPPPGSLGPNPLRYQAYSVRVTAGGTIWSTEDEDDKREKLPRCEVGGWDTKEPGNPFEALDKSLREFFDGVSDIPTRDMDCRWKC